MTERGHSGSACGGIIAFAMPSDQSSDHAPSPVAAATYTDVAAIYDALMRGVPHGLWVSRMEKAARDRGRSPVSALDIACGTGLATEHLARRGYAPVVGVDLAESMVAIARTKAIGKNLTIEYLAQDAAELDLGGRRFDLIISQFDSLNYITDPAKLQAAFRRIRAHASDHAVFTFDMNSIYALSKDLFTQSDDDGKVRHDWSASWDRETRLCTVTMRFWVKDNQNGAERAFVETHIQRAYTIPEVREWLEDAGFGRVECFGNYGERPPGPRSDRLLFVAEAV